MRCCLTSAGVAVNRLGSGKLSRCIPNLHSDCGLLSPLYTTARISTTVTARGRYVDEEFDMTGTHSSNERRGIPDLAPSKSEKLSRADALATLKRGSDSGYALLQRAKEQRNYTLALDIIEEAADRGIRPPAAYWEVAVETLHHIRDAAPALRLHNSLRQWGYDCSVSVIKSLLEIYATTRCSKGVHMIVKAIQNSMVQLSDPVLERLAFAYFAVGSLDKSFNIIDMYRATGGPADRILFYIISSTPHMVVRHGEHRRQLIQGMYRKVMNYVLLTQSPLPTEINTLARSFTFSSPLHNELNLRSMLPELLSHKKITDALQPDVLQRILNSLLVSQQIRFMGRSGYLHFAHTLEDLALGTIPGTLPPYLQRRALYNFLFPEVTVPDHLPNEIESLMAAYEAQLQELKEGSGIGDEPVDVVASTSSLSSAHLSSEDSDKSSAEDLVSVGMKKPVDSTGSEEEDHIRTRPRRVRVAGERNDDSVRAASKHAKLLRVLQDRVSNYIQRTKAEYTGPLYGSMEGVVALSSWRHDNALTKAEQANRYLRYCCAVYLHLQALGQQCQTNSVNRLFAALAKSGRTLAALQVARDLVAQKAFVTDALPIHNLIMGALAQNILEHEHLVEIIKMVIQELVPPVLLDMYMEWLRTHKMRSMADICQFLPGVPTAPVITDAPPDMAIAVDTEDPPEDRDDRHTRRASDISRDYKLPPMMSKAQIADLLATKGELSEGDGEFQGEVDQDGLEAQTDEQAAGEDAPAEEDDLTSEVGELLSDLDAADSGATANLSAGTASGPSGSDEEQMVRRPLPAKRGVSKR